MKLPTLFSSGAEAFEEAADQAGGTVRPLGKKAPIQVNPVTLKDAAGTEYRVFVDAVARTDGKLVVLGWTSSPIVKIDLLQGTTKLPAKLSRHARGDVAAALNLTSGDTLGFCIVADMPVSKATLELSVALPNVKPYQSGPLAEASGLTNVQQTLVPNLLDEKIARLKTLEMGSPEWLAALARLPETQNAPVGFHGFVEGIFVSPEGNGVVFGWALHPEDGHVWLEDELLNIHPIQGSFRRVRRDISDAHRSLPWGHMEAAFISHLPTISETPTIKLRAATNSGVVTLSERSGAEMLPSDPRSVAKKLFDIETEDRDFHRRVNLIDWPILQPVIKKYREDVSTIVPQIATYGTLPEAPAVSVIIPLYNRSDLMEHQVLEFCRDPFLRRNAEVIFVIDDPQIRTDVLKEADLLFRLYGLAFKVIWGLRNRGFSGANNLGAEHANAAYLLFMNSDVIPMNPGWLEKMLEGCQDDQVGAVGVRLLLPDGSIQNDGLTLELDPETRLCLPFEINSGIAPCDIQSADVKEPQFLSGACLMLRKDKFMEIGGWSCDLLCDFGADIVFSQSLKEKGLHLKLEIETPLVHLNQQSIIGIGDTNFRGRARIVDAAGLLKDISINSDPQELEEQ